MSSNKKIKIAILDLYEGHANQGMRCLREIVNQWSEFNNYDVQLDEFDVRLKLEIPDLSYDIFISSGGPGSPLDSENLEWENKYFHWIHQVEKWNNNYANYPKKNVFFICHSFQLACRYFKIAKVCKRKSTAFGVFPIHILQNADSEEVFHGLSNPFYGVDSRDYQAIEPNHNRINEIGGRILAIEKERRHVPYERALMSVRFNEYFIGTQFHPEADAEGMTMYLLREDKKKTVIESYGEQKWQSMIEHLTDPDKIIYTYKHVMPNFLNIAVNQLIEN